MSPLYISPASRTSQGVSRPVQCPICECMYVCPVCICPASGECRTSQGVSCPVQCPVMFASQRASPNCPGRQLATLPLYHFAEYTHSGKRKHIALLQLDRKYHTLSTSQRPVFFSRAENNKCLTVHEHLDEDQAIGLQIVIVRCCTNQPADGGAGQSSLDMRSV